MRRIRIQKKIPHPRRDRYEIQPLDLRDPDVVRAKRSRTPLTREGSERRAA